MKRLLPVLVLLLLLLAGACGVPQEDAAVVADDESVPFGLLAPLTTTTSTTSTTIPPVIPDRIVDVCLVHGDGVVAVERTLERRRTLEEVVEQLRQGPTPTEVAFGLTTALPEPEAVGSVVLSGGTVAVALGESFALAPAPEQVLGVAQLVCTLTGQPGVGRVQFLFDSQPVQVPLPDGSLSAGSVSRDDYAPLLRFAAPQAAPDAGTG